MERQTPVTTSIEKINELNLGKTSKLKLFVWRVRRFVRDSLKGKDVLEVTPTAGVSDKMRETYRAVDAFMTRYFPGIVSDTPVDVATKMIHDKAVELGYTIVEEDTKKPWGASFRMDSTDSDRFIEEFFPGLTITEAKLGRDDVELSPKFLLIAPGQRFSWQLHARRAERWRYLNDGGYYKSNDPNEPGDLIHVHAGDIVQFEAGECHRCEAPADSYTLVAEIWQHTAPGHPSDEADITRLQDDYNR